MRFCSQALVCLQACLDVFTVNAGSTSVIPGNRRLISFKFSCVEMDVQDAPQKFVHVAISLPVLGRVSILKWFLFHLLLRGVVRGEVCGKSQ